MPTISKELAEKEIKKLRGQKKPKVYCVARYQNRLSGDSEKGTYSDYSICYNCRHYDALLNSPGIGGVDILWESEMFKNDVQKALLEDLLDVEGDD